MPAAQLVQLAEFTVDEYLPAGHGLHALPVKKFPAGQVEEQEVEPAALEVPLAQAEHAAALATAVAANVPAAQGRHC